MNISYKLKDTKILPLNTKYIDPWDKTEFVPKKGEDFYSFLERVKEHNTYVDNSILEEFVQLSLAHNLESGVRELGKFFDTIKKPINMLQGLNALKALSQEAFSKSVVSCKQRQERVKICLSCPLHANKSNMTIGGRVFSVALNTVDKIKGVTKDKDCGEQKLGICSLCGCPMDSKVKFSVVNILPTITPEQLEYSLKRKVKCWIIEEASKDIYMKQLLFKKIAVINGVNTFKEVYEK